MSDIQDIKKGFRKLRSIKTRFSLVLISSIIYVSALTMITVVPPMQSITKTSAKNYMLDLSKSYAELLEQTINIQGRDYLTNKVLEDLLRDVGVTDVDSSYAYLVGTNGIMLYHPDESKIGKSVENQAVQQIVKSLQLGEDIEGNVVSYNYKGKEKYAGYGVVEPVDWIVVITADKEDILVSTNSIIDKTIVVCGVFSLLITLLGYLLARSFIKPLDELTSYRISYKNCNLSIC